MKAIRTDSSPGAVGPYSQAIKRGKIVFISGQLPVDPTTGKIVKGSIEEQTVRTLENIKGIAEAAGGGMSDIVRTTVYLVNIDDFVIMNTIYSSYFNEPYPARSCIEASRLPKGALVEIDAIMHL